MPNFKFDWTFNVGHIISMAVFILAGIGAWYDVKSDVKVFDNKFKQVEAFMVTQKHQDEIQDAQRDAIAKEIKESLRDTRNDIKQEIRDLRNDLNIKRH